MTLVPGVLLGVALTWALGGDLRLLGRLRFRSIWLVYCGLALQLVLFGPGERLPQDPRGALHVATYLLVLAFVARNRAIPGLLVVGAGIALNALVIALNGGFMPVDPQALTGSGAALGDYAHGPVANTILRGSETLLWPLGDIFAVPDVGWLVPVSIGDLLLLAGSALVVFRACTQTPPAGFGGYAEVMRVPAFRRLMTIQAVSATCSWIVPAVLVGWAYDSGGGLWGSTAVLLVRGVAGVIAGYAGGAVADRLGRARVLFAADLAQALALGLIIVGIESDAVALVYAAYFAVIAIAVGTDGPLRALVAGTVRERQGLLPMAYGALGTLHGAAMAVGAICGGLVGAAAGPVPALAACIGAYALTALGYRSLWQIAPVDAAVERGRVEAGGRPGRLVILAAIALPVTMFALATLGTGLLSAALPAVLGRAGVGTVWGVGIGMIGAGQVVGQLVGGALPADHLRSRTIAVMLACMGGACLIAGSVAALPTVLAALFAFGCFDGVTETVFDTVVESLVPESALGTAFGTAQAVFTATMLLGIAAAPLLGTAAATSALYGSAALLVIAGLAGLAGDGGVLRLRRPARAL